MNIRFHISVEFKPDRGSKAVFKTIKHYFGRADLLPGWVKIFDEDGSTIIIPSDRVAEVRQVPCEDNSQISNLVNAMLDNGETQ